MTTRCSDHTHGTWGWLAIIAALAGMGVVGATAVVLRCELPIVLGLAFGAFFIGMFLLNRLARRHRCPICGSRTKDISGPPDPYLIKPLVFFCVHCGMEWETRVTHGGHRRRRR